MKTKIPFLFVFSFLALPAHAQGTSTLTLDEAIREAQKQSPKIDISEAQMDASDWGKTEALSSFLPKLNFDATHYFGIKFQTLNVSIPPLPPINFPFVMPTTTYTLGFSLNLFNGFQDYDRLGAARLKATAAHAENDWTRFQLEQEVRLDYYSVIAARALESVAEENVLNLEQHLKQVQDMMKVGEAIEVDVLRVQVQLNTARTQKLNAHDSAIIAQQHLAQALGKSSESRSPAGDLPIPDDRIASAIEQVSREEAQKLEHRSDIQADSLQAQAADKAESAAAHYWVPSLSFVGNYQFYNNIDSNPTNADSFKSAYQYGIELTWNIFDGLLSYARSKEAVALARQAAKSEALARIQASTDIEVNQSDYRLNLARFLTNTENLERSKRSVQLALSGLHHGTQTNTDVLDAELDLFNARAGVIQAQMDSVEAQIKFENAIGRKI